MIQFCIKSQKVIDIIQYPKGINPHRQSCCKYNNQIYIIDGENGVIILFDPESKIFVKKAQIHKIGQYPSSAVLLDKIHIFHGDNNEQYHLVYDPIKNTVNTNSVQTDKICFASSVVYENNIIKFSGYNCTGSTGYDEVMISNICDDNVEWIEKPNWRLPFANDGCGYILYRHFIVMFGGQDNWYQWLDTIYLLDLTNNDQGWKKLDHIKCPIPSKYLAVLTPDNHVHLLTDINKWPNWQESNRGHWSISMKDLMGEYYPYRFDLNVLKDVDVKTRDIVYGYFRNEQSDINQIIPNDVIDICLVYYLM